MTCSAAARSALRALALLAALAALACASGGTGTARRSLADLTNPALGPDYSQWLVGAISRLATPQEVQDYLALRDDAAAEEFTRQFWARRDPTPDRPDNALREAFEQRSAEADRRFSEAGFLGRRTARGEIFVLYGPPTKLDFDISPRPGDPAVEVWTYDRTAPSGLDGRAPAPLYKFIKRGDLTVPYIPGRPEERLPARPRPDSDGRR